MRKLLVFVLLLGLGVSSYAGDNPAAAGENTCYTQSVEAARGTSFPVKVFVNNSDTLAGMQVPIYYRSENVDLKCDSVTFAGSRCGYFALSDSKIEPVGKTVYFAFILMTDPNQEVKPLLPGDGPVATLWFTAPGDIKAGPVMLDSGPNAFFPHDKIDYSFLFWTPAAQQVDFAYRPGTITIK